MRKLCHVLLVATLILQSGCARPTTVCPPALALPDSIIQRLERDGSEAEWNWLDQHQKQQEMLLP